MLPAISSMSGESEYIFQIFRGIRQSHVHVQQIGVMSFLYEGFTDSCSGDQGDVTLPCSVLLPNTMIFMIILLL